MTPAAGPSGDSPTFEPSPQEPRSPRRLRIGVISAVVLVVAAALTLLLVADDDEDAGDSTTTTTTETSATTTTTEASTTMTTAAPAGWELVEVDFPVRLGSSGNPDTGQASPPGSLPAEGWPRDGVYRADAVFDAASVSPLRLTIWRRVSCAEQPDRCLPDAAPDALVTDSGSEISRTLVLDDSVRVVIRPINDTRALSGTGRDLAALLEDLESAVHDHIVEPYQAGRTGEEIEADLIVRGADPGFPFGLEPSQGEPLAYRGPLGTYLTASARTPEYWNENVHGLWPATLEMRDSRPTLYIDASQWGG